MKIFRTALCQAKADLRPQLWGISILTFIFNPLVFVGLGYYWKDSLGDISLAFGVYFVIGTIGSFGVWLCIQIVNEVYVERLNGTLLRVKTLPHGVGGWMLGKTMSAGAFLFLQMIVVVVLTAIMIDGFEADLSHLLLGVGIGVISILAHVPLAFALSIIARSTWITMFLYLVCVAIAMFNGSVIPLSIFPQWVGVIAKILPGYWSGYLTRQVFFDSATISALGDKPGLSWLALLLLLAWIVIGSALVAKLWHKSIRKETMSTFAAMVQKTQRQLGVA